MRFTLTIDCDNDAFYPFVPAEHGGSPVGEGGELERLIRVVADAVAAGDEAGKVRDCNGNTVGCWLCDTNADEAPPVPTWTPTGDVR